MSMLRSQLTCGTDRHFSVLHGARHSWDLGYREHSRRQTGQIHVERYW